MSLLADLRSVTVRSDAPCPVGELLKSLTTEEADALSAALVPGVLGARRIQAILAANGHTLVRSKIEEHKRRECSCGPG